MSEQDDGEIQEFTIRQRGMIVERDARGRIISAYVPPPLLIDQLFEHGIIDCEQHWHAEQFITMHRVFLRPVATFKMVSAYAQSDDGAPVIKYPIADNDYLIVLRDIRHEWQRLVIKRAIEEDYDIRIMYELLEKQESGEFTREAEGKRNRVSNAFWALTYAINRLLEKKEKAKEAEEERKKVLARGEKPCDDGFDGAILRDQNLLTRV
jgi:hypothetical protein